MSDKAKKILTIILIPILILCMVSIAFYVVIASFFKKTINTVVEVGAIRDTYVWEVNYWSNENNNGVELLDIRINGFLDENQIDAENPILYSKGIQIVGEGQNSIKINGTDVATAGTVGNYVGTVLFWFWGIFSGYDYNIQYNPNYKAYYYDSQNNVSFSSIEKLNSDTYFKIPITVDGQEELFLMKLLGQSKEPTRTEGSVYERRYYENYNINYLCSKILDISRSNSVNDDATGPLLVDFGNCFTYRKYSDTAGSWITETNTDLYNTIYENFCTIDLTVHEDGANKAEDSMFGMIANSADYENVSEDYVDNFFVGHQVIDFTESNFTSLNGEFDLNETSAKFLSNNKDLYINVIIDTDKLAETEVEFNNLSANYISKYATRTVSFKLKSVNSSGETIYTEVQL